MAHNYLFFCLWGGGWGRCPIFVASLAKWEENGESRENSKCTCKGKLMHHSENPLNASSLIRLFWNTLQHYSKFPSFKYACLCLHGHQFFEIKGSKSKALWSSASSTNLCLKQQTILSFPLRISKFLQPWQKSRPLNFLS